MPYQSLIHACTVIYQNSSILYYQRMLKCPVFCKGFLLETAHNILTTWKTAATCLKKLETVIVTGRNESRAVPISSAFQLSCLSGVPLFGRSSDDFRKLSYGEKVEPAEERYRSTQHRVHQWHAATTNVTKRIKQETTCNALNCNGTLCCKH